MSPTLDCGRAQELLSDHIEDALDPVLRADVDAHLARCPDCRELRAALVEVVAALADVPEIATPEGLAERVALGALQPRDREAIANQEERKAPPAARREAWRMPPAWLAAAAALALTVSGAVLALAAPEQVLPSRVVNRALDAGVYLAEKKDRLVDDFRILRVVIATVFEGRVDRMNDRVDDYRKLLQRRRDAAQVQQKKSLNNGGDGFVKLCEQWGESLPRRKS